MEELVGTYQSTRYRNEDMDFWVGFTEGGQTITGTVTDGIPEQGRTYRFFGHWKNSPKYGKQFKSAVFTEHEPHNREAVLAYLKRHLRGTGIGEKGFIRVWDAYGSESIRVLRTQPIDVARSLNFSEDSCIAASKRLAEHARTEHTAVDLMGLFAGRGFPAATIRAAIDKWGAMAPAIIRRDPFSLMTHSLPGCGFARCDTLYMSLGLDPSRLKRQTLCAWNHLVQSGSGDTWFPIEAGAEGIRLKVGSADIHPARALKLGVRSKWLRARLDEDGKRWIGDHDKTGSEISVAESVMRLADAAALWPAIDASGSRLTEHQQGQLAAATASPFGILSGTPGTGKTFTAAALIRAIIRQHGDGSVVCMAPTGKAGVRLSESLSRAGVEIVATTIHRALRPQKPGHGTGEWGFLHGRENPIPAKYIIVDESSMIDTDLMASLLRACATGTHVLLIGDPYQLPPVGHGAPLRDLIAANVAHGQLTEIQRNSGLIVEACRSIRLGQRIKTCQRMDDAGNNLRVGLAPTPAAVIDHIEKVYAAVVAKGTRDPVDEIQVLVGLNDQGQLSRKKLNPLIQSILNPNGARVDGVSFRVGDKVICTSNGWYPLDGEKNGMTEFLANGEMGRVLSLDKLQMVIGFQATTGAVRRIRIPLKTEFAKSFELAYAITCHKSQGSEWPVVLIVADEAAFRVCSREWWYTAVSRAKSRCLILGRLATVEKQSKRISLEKRKTFLVEEIATMRAQQDGGGNEGCHATEEASTEMASQAEDGNGRNHALPAPISPSFETLASSTHTSSADSREPAARS